MQLRTVRIHNFRGLLDQRLELKPYTLLVGANNAGKSTIIDAVRAFYEKDGFKFRKDGDAPYVGATDKESWIELTFVLAADEFDSLKDEYKTVDRALRVRKYLETTEKGADGKSRAGFIHAYLPDGTLATESFYGAKNVQSGKFGDLIYVPAIGRVDEYAKLSGPSALRDLLGEILSGVVESGTAYATFRTEVDRFATAVRDEKTADERSLSGFESELNRSLGSWGPEFKLRFSTPSAADMIKSMVAWDVIDAEHKQPLDMERYGSGFQRHFIYSLISLATRYAGKRAPKKSKDFQPTFNFVLFEEPEAFLHPAQQEELAKNLRGLANEAQWQVMCATHSPVFVSRATADVPSIACVQRRSGTVLVSQATDETWSKIIDCNLTIAEVAQKYPRLKKRFSPDDARPEMEVLKHFLWLSPDRATIFFARHVLLVEGMTEVALINRLIGDGKIRNAGHGLCVVDCLGKYNVHRFMNLLICLQIPHSALCDDDGGKEEHADLNGLIKGSAAANLTGGIEFIAGDVETFLGIPRAESSHRKPQHVLYHYESARIAPDRIQAFCHLVEAVLPGAAAGTRTDAMPSAAAAGVGAVAAVS
jgi:hypothetical protein